MGKSNQTKFSIDSPDKQSGLTVNGKFHRIYLSDNHTLIASVNVNGVDLETWRYTDNENKRYVIFVVDNSACHSFMECVAPVIYCKAVLATQPYAEKMAVSKAATMFMFEQFKAY